MRSPGTSSRWRGGYGFASPAPSFQVITINTSPPMPALGGTFGAARFALDQARPHYPRRRRTAMLVAATGVAVAGRSPRTWSRNIAEAATIEA